MEYAVGAGLALVVVLFGALVGFDRDRAFYPIMLTVIASYYVLFAAMAGSRQGLIVEAMVLAGFVAVAAIGFRWSLWLVAAGLAGHGLFDFLRSGVHESPGTPSWWPGFCLAFDVVAGAWLALRLLRGKRARTPQAASS